MSAGTYEKQSAAGSSFLWLQEVSERWQVTCIWRCRATSQTSEQQLRQTVWTCVCAVTLRHSNAVQRSPVVLFSSLLFCKCESMRGINKGCVDVFWILLTCCWRSGAVRPFWKTDQRLFETHSRTVPQRSSHLLVEREDLGFDKGILQTQLTLPIQFNTTCKNEG